MSYVVYEAEQIDAALNNPKKSLFTKSNYLDICTSCSNKKCIMHKRLREDMKNYLTMEEQYDLLDNFRRVMKYAGCNKIITGVYGKDRCNKAIYDRTTFNRLLYLTCTKMI